MTCRTVNHEAIKRRQARLAKKAAQDQENSLKDERVWVNGQAYSSTDGFINDMENQFDQIVRSTPHFKRTR